MKRDLSLDFWRGLAIISVIMIHTMFHSGASYVPLNIACYSLLLDIPAFMLISGMTYAIKGSFSGKIKEIFKLLYRYFIFVIILFIYLFIADRDAVFFKDFFSWMSFSPVTLSEYSIGVNYSLWFMIYYIQSVLVCSLLIDYINNKKLDKKYFVYLIFIFIFLLLSANYGVTYFSFSANMVGFSLFFLVGYYAYNNNFLNKFWKYLISLGLLLISIYYLFKFNGYIIDDLQVLKGKMNYLYVLVSMISLFTIIYLKDKFKYKSFFSKIICFVGKNSICMYFAQGVSSSIMYFIEPNITMALGYKITVMFLINLCISSAIFIILYYIFKLGDILYKKVF